MPSSPQESTPKKRRPVHGVLLLDKPLGLSSNQALQKCKWLLRAEKAGHTGTLDPLATGILPLCFGAATKFGQLQLDADKTYEATVRLGVTTTTGDAEGEVTATQPVPAFDDATLAGIARRFTGPIRQVPPMHSALKKDGKPLYEYARQGEVIEREPRDVTIHALELTAIDAQHLKLVARVSKGTYIRTLGEDVAHALGCGGHLTSLRRTATGGLGVTLCVTIEQLEAADPEARVDFLRPVDALLGDHTPVTLGDDDAGRFLSGMRRRGGWADNDHVAVFAPRNILLGTAHVRAGELIPGRLLSPIEIQQILQPAP
jgi:tRNA pseudouridine55 synthase